MTIAKKHCTCMHDKIPLVDINIEYPQGFDENTDKAFEKMAVGLLDFAKGEYFSEYASLYEKSDIKRKRLRFERAYFIQKVKVSEYDGYTSFTFTVRAVGYFKKFSLTFDKEHFLVEKGFADSLIGKTKEAKKLLKIRNRQIYMQNGRAYLYQKNTDMKEFVIQL